MGNEQPVTVHHKESLKASESLHTLLSYPICIPISQMSTRK